MHPIRTYSWFPLALLWFGASMSVAEIHTGGLTAAAGITPGIVAIIAGHLVGITLLGLMGYIGFKEGMPSLMCTRIAFGKRGSWLLSLANILQLLGWTAVMLQQNSQALGGITRSLWGVDFTQGTIVVMGCLVALWAFWETQGKHTGNTVAVLLLGALAVFISWVLFFRTEHTGQSQVPVTMSFAEAFELSLIMPLSWVPLVADYACRAKNVRAACFAPAFGYFVGSIWMYGLGFAGALLTGEASPTPMLLAAGLGIIALSVLALSTVATTFLDIYSAVASTRNVLPKLPEKLAGLIIVVLGTSIALVWDSALYMHFLHSIGAIFAPLSAILFTDYFLLRCDSRNLAVSFPSIISLLCGIGGYLFFSVVGTPFGPTLSCLGLTMVLHLLLRKFAYKKQQVV